MSRDVEGLTGKVRYRFTLFGKCVIQVEESAADYDWRGGGSHSPSYTYWRDAKIEDLQELGLTLTVNGDE